MSDDPIIKLYPELRPGESVTVRRSSEPVRCTECGVRLGLNRGIDFEADNTGWRCLNREACGCRRLEADENERPE